MFKSSLLGVAVWSQTPLPQAEMERLAALGQAEAAVYGGADPDGIDPSLTCSAVYSLTLDVGDMRITSKGMWRVDTDYIAYGFKVDKENCAALKDMISAADPQAAADLANVEVDDFVFGIQSYEAGERMLVYEKVEAVLGGSPSEMEVCFDDTMANIEAGLAELEELEEQRAGPQGAERMEADEVNPMADPAVANLMQMLPNPSVSVDGTHETVAFGPMGSFGTVEIDFMPSGPLKSVVASCPTAGVSLDLKVAEFQTPAPEPDDTPFAEPGCGDLDAVTMADIVTMAKASGRRLVDADSLKKQMTMQTAHALRHAHKMVHDYKDAKASATFWYTVRRCVEALVVLFLAVVVVRGMKRYLGKTRESDEHDAELLLDDESPYAATYAD